MTAPVTGYTPAFQLPYLQQGQPIFEHRQISEDLAKRLETVLASKAVSPPGAADLTALAARVGTLEADQAAEDTDRNAAAVTFASGFAQFAAAPYGELVKAWRSSPGNVQVVGLVQVTTAVAASATPVTVLTLPAGYRPAVNLVRDAMFQSGATAPTYWRVNVLTTGVVQIVPATALTTATFLQLDLKFRTVNT